MFALSYGAFFCFLLGLVVAVFSLRLDFRSNLNRAMALLALGYSIYAFSYIWIYGSTNQHEVWFYYHLSTFGLFVLVLPLCFWVDLLFAQVGLRLRLALFFPFFLSYVTLFIYGLTHSLIYQDFRPTRWGNMGVSAPPEGWGAIAALYVAQSILAFFFLLALRAREKSKRIRRLILVLVAGSAGLAIFSTLQDAFTRYFELPSLEIFQGLLTTGLLVYLTVRYRYLRTDSVTLEKEIVKALKEAVVLVGPDLKITKVNPITKVLLGRSEEDLLSKELTSLFDQSDSIRREWEQAVAAGKTTELLGVTVRSSDVELVLAPSFDSFGDLVGGVALIRANDVFGSTLAQYGITARERDVLLLLLRGYNRKEIAESKFIAPSTVKNHIHNIYEKTGAANRVELLLMLGGS